MYLFAFFFVPQILLVAGASRFLSFYSVFQFILFSRQIYTIKYVIVLCSGSFFFAFFIIIQFEKTSMMFQKQHEKKLLAVPCQEKIV